MPPLYVLLAACWLVFAAPAAGLTAGQDFDLPLFIPAITSLPLSLDSDGDGLPDLWELRGYYENGVFVDLPALGADPRHKDLFVWMDYMVKDGTSLAPSQTVIDNIKAVFANAPVANPDGKTGITIHPVLKNQVPYKESLGVKGDDASVWTDFDTLKNASLTPAYARSHRYMIWANAYQQGSSSGLARDIPATDFIVSLGAFPTVGGTDWEKLGTFIHELGHCLGLLHGGSDDTNYKPNYLSIMSYSFQMSGLYKDGHFGDTAPGYPLNYDYQRQDTPDLNENSLNENLGLTGAGSVSGYGTVFYYFANNACTQVSIANANAAIDWNQDHQIEAGVVFGIHCDPDEPAEESKITLTAQSNWKNINYSASGLIGPSLTKTERARRLQAPIPESLKHELNLETYQKLKNAAAATAP